VKPFGSLAADAVRRSRQEAAMHVVRAGVAVVVGLLAGVLAAWPRAAHGQSVRIRDLVMPTGALPVRLVGYGLVVGLDGTGDRAMVGRGMGQTVVSIANLLRRFQIEVPAEVLQPRNVAAVMVTAEVSPYLRPGGRFDLHVASIGDARSLKGGVLFVTPLLAEVGGEPVATAQGPLLMSDGSSPRDTRGPVENAARIPAGGLLEVEFVRPTLAEETQLLLREPDLATATRIAAVVDSAIGTGTAIVEDPGAVRLALTAQGGERAALLARIAGLRVEPERPTRVVIDGRDGTVVAGGDLTLGPAVVAHGPVTLSIGSPADSTATRGDVRFPAGTTVQRVASALHAVQVTPGEIAAILSSLRDVGALAADVVIR
jgi:flagellar P-ring protein precursor FlgI